MNKAEFIALIENPGKLDKSHVSALKNIAEDFPYFQANHILLTRALFNENHYEYEKQLRTTALLVPNRELLYRFLHDHPIQETNNKVSIVEVSIPEVETEAEVEIGIMEEEIAQPIPELVTEITVEEIILEEPAVIEEIPLESIELSVELIAEEPIVIAITEPVITDVVEQDQVEPLLESVTEEPAAFVADANEVHSFSEWLKLSKEKHLPEVPPQPEEVPAIKEVVEPEEKPVSVEKEPEIQEVKSTEQPVKSNLHQFESILDKFIRENPSISRPKAEFYKPANVAKQSVEEDDDLVTETLANIYYQQGAHRKAIRAYEKLCLIYPHKMSYFAALIQKIKDENKND